MDFEENKYYKVSSKEGDFCTLFKYNNKNVKSHPFVNDYLLVAAEESITIRNDAILIAKRNYIDLRAKIEEIDESVFNKAIKYFNMSKAAISAIINQDKANEEKENTTQGDYQLP